MNRLFASAAWAWICGLGIGSLVKRETPPAVEESVPASGPDLEAMHRELLTLVRNAENGLENKIDGLRQTLLNVENGLENKIAALTANGQGAQERVLRYLSDLRRSAVAMQLHTRFAAYEARQATDASAAVGRVPRALPEPTLEQTFTMLAERHERLYPVWRELLEAGERSYRAEPNDSLSVYDNPGSVVFRTFCMPLLRGDVLDIGCGPVPVPIYLDGYDLARVAGIDPFGSAAMHPFLFVPAVAEQIPWPDKSFDVAVVATSLDHLIDLELGMSEIARVLKPNGELLAWVYFVAGAPRYDPSAGGGKIDEFHLFHFDRPWFLELVDRHFSILEEINLDDASYFYRLMRKPPPAR